MIVFWLGCFASSSDSVRRRIDSCWIPEWDESNPGIFRLHSVWFLFRCLTFGWFHQFSSALIVQLPVCSRTARLHDLFSCRSLGLVPSFFLWCVGAKQGFFHWFLHGRNSEVSVLSDSFVPSEYDKGTNKIFDRFRTQRSCSQCPSVKKCRKDRGGSRSHHHDWSICLSQTKSPRSNRKPKPQKAGQSLCRHTMTDLWHMVY